MPTLAQMKMALMSQRPTTADLQSIGVDEAPDLHPKTYISPVKGANQFVPPGGVSTPSGMPIGGIDMSRQQPGQQLMPQQPQMQPQQPSGMGGMGGGMGAPDQGQQGPQSLSNILQLTPQGQALSAMKPNAPQGPQPPGMAGGGEVEHMEGGGSKRITKRQQTVKNPQRMAYPGVYDRPDVIASEAAGRVAPEDPDLKQLFGVTREEMYEQAKGREGNLLGALPGAAANPKGAEAAENVMNPRNTQRLVDVLAEAGKHPELMHGMDAWYYMDPMFKRMVELLGIDRAREEYRKMNALMGMASASSGVETEIPRGSAAHYLSNLGRFEEFAQHGGKRDPNRPEILGDVPGHLAHKTAHVVPMRNFLERGEVAMGSPKVPMYIEASGVPEIGFQTRTPVGDAHWSRAVGLADTRNIKKTKGKEMVPGQSVSNPEMSTLGPWWREKVAKQVGLESVPAQARIWGAMAPQTGVETPVGAPKLELIAKQIRKTAKRLGISIENARDLILSGKERMGYKKGGNVSTSMDAMRLALTKRKAK